MPVTNEEAASRNEFDADKVKGIVEGIIALLEEKDELLEQIKELKSNAASAGISKKQLTEALRLAKMDSDERSLLLTGANKCLKAIGRLEIDLNFHG